MSKIHDISGGMFCHTCWIQILSEWSSWDFLSPSVLQKMKWDNISQLDDFDAPFCEQQYTHGPCYFSLFKFKSFDQFNPLNCLKFQTFTQLWYCSLFRNFLLSSFLSCGLSFDVSWYINPKIHKVAFSVFRKPSYLIWFETQTFSNTDIINVWILKAPKEPR